MGDPKQSSERGPVAAGDWTTWRTAEGETRYRCSNGHEGHESATEASLCGLSVSAPSTEGGVR